jgi:hypothetical protein
LIPRGPCDIGGYSRDYDDGNGLWISSGETPSDQPFSRCICPQDYTHLCVLSSEAIRARGTEGSVRGVMSSADESFDQVREKHLKEAATQLLFQMIDQMTAAEALRLVGRLSSQGYSD